MPLILTYRFFWNYGGFCLQVSDYLEVEHSDRLMRMMKGNAKPMWGGNMHFPLESRHGRAVILLAMQNVVPYRVPHFE
jgi:hypothetical protein